jgi:ParB family protein of integrating conjugative element (PFGI_1 class)
MSGQRKFVQPLTVRPSQSVTQATSTMNKLDTARAAMANSALSVKSPALNPVLAPADSTQPVLRVSVTEVETYEKNPRREINDKYDEIKASIKASGIETVIQVARIPGRSKFVCASGANTRLRIVQELWAETQDPRFETVWVKIEAWRGHARAIADHVKENTLRGDMSYWDKACACLAIRDELTQETGKTPGVRELCELLNNSYGFVVDTAMLSRYLHVAEHFEPLGTYLNNPVSKTLVPASNALLRLSIKFDIEEANAWEEIELNLDRYAATLKSGASFDTNDCIQAMQTGMAIRLGLTSHQLEFALTALERDPNAGKSDLIALSAVPASVTQLRRPVKAPESDSDLFVDSGNGDAEASDSTKPSEPLQARQQSTLQTASAGQTSAPASVSPFTASAPRVPNRVLDVDAALELVINACTDFAAACYIDDWIATGRSLPMGYYMEIRDPEANGIPYIKEALPNCTDPRVRVGAWWMGAALSRQWDQDQVLLLPSDSMWRQVWSEESREAYVEGTLFSVIQEGLGGVLSDSGLPCVPIEYLTVVLADPKRAALYTELCSAVNVLNAARNKT